jgi:serine protease Do
MTLLIRAICVAISALVSVPLYAQSNPDIDAAARSVVRVVVLAPDEEGTREALGMGSGVAISPTRIITNAHVVEAAVERGGFVGIVPSEGRKRYVGEVVAYSAALDLAIIALKSGSITPASIYTGAVTDGMSVAALGYPYGVDRAMASGVEDVIRPQSPVKSLGNVGGLRKNERFDTVLHDAAIGRGNSGGPLIDTCGRIIGINSFLSISEGIDSTFAFAISAREVVAFLQKAKITPAVATTPCLSQGDVAAREAALTRADEDAAAISARRAEGDAAKAAAEKARIRDDIMGERENGMAIAAALFGLGLVSIVGGIVLFGQRTKQQRRLALAALALGGIALLAAIFVFLTRPKLSDVEDRYAAAHPTAPVKLAAASTGDGEKLCVFNPDRSRVTISKTDNVPITWADNGCVNGKTQYGSNAGVWSRTFVPNTEATITIQSYDPAKTRYTVERFLMGADAMEKARAIRARYKNNACTPDPAQRKSVADMESAIRAVLPQTPNERIIFECQSDVAGGGKATP